MLSFQIVSNVSFEISQWGSPQLETVDQSHSRYAVPSPPCEESANSYHRLKSVFVLSSSLSSRFISFVSKGYGIAVNMHTEITILESPFFKVFLY